MGFFSFWNNILPKLLPEGFSSVFPIVHPFLVLLQGIRGFLKHGTPELIFPCWYRAGEATSRHPSILTTFKPFQYVGSLITSIVWKTKWREMIIGTKGGGCKSSNQIQGRLEQYGFFKVAMIMSLITLPGQKGSLLSINPLPPANPPPFFSEQKYQLRWRKIFFLPFLIRTVLHPRNHAVAKRYIFSIVYRDIGQQHQMKKKVDLFTPSSLLPAFVYFFREVKAN